MNHCCSGGHSAAPAVTARLKRRTWPRRALAFVEWALPLTAIALVPKCPACVAGYVLLFTGVGLSMPAAAAVRWVLIVLCTAALVYLLLRLGCRVLNKRTQSAS